MTMHPGTGMRLRLHLWMRVVVTHSGGGDYMLDVLLDFSTPPKQTQTSTTSTSNPVSTTNVNTILGDIERP